MRSVLISLFLCACLQLPAQSIELRAGRNGIPGNYLSVGYEHYSNYVFNLAGRLIAEGSMINQLRYKAYGIDLLAEYGSKQDDNVGSIFAFRVGLGATGQIENEPWVYGGYTFSKRFSYGVVGEATGEWAMSPAFSLCPFIQQKYLFNSNLGSTRFVFGLGIKFSFNQ